MHFAADLAGSPNQKVDWAVADAGGGTIDANGSYTAPAAEGTYTVTASLTGTVTTRQESRVNVRRGVRVSVTPLNASLAAGQTISLFANVSGTSNKAVTWSVAESDGGSVAADGTYTAPATAGVYHVFATSAVDPSRSGTSTITVTDAPVPTTPVPAPVPPPVVLAVSPQTASVVEANTVQLTATVSGTSNTAVTWSVQEAGGGTVSAAGLYGAPLVVGTFHVVATSVADPSKTAAAAITVTPTPPAPAVSVAISPATTSISAGGSVQFTATVSGTTSTGVSWTVQEGAGGGSVSSTGRYTAPSTAGTYHVVATSQADASKTSSATVTVTAPTPTPTPTPTPAPPAGVVPAFPGAGGSGALSKGGRGGTVYKVTKLTDDGSAGTLRACVQASGPRTCVFTVSGVINITKNMNITNPYLTIAGQTAPGAGIALRTQPGVTPGGTWIFDVQTHDVIIRYLKFWGDYISGEPAGGGGGFGIAVHDPAQNLIVDHSDMLWFTGEGYDHWGTTIANTTLQWSIVGENVNGTGSGQSTPVKMTSSDYVPGHMHNVDLHHNLITTGNERNPLLCTDSSRIVNNVIYNWRFFASATDNGGSADWIGNYWKPGPFEKNRNTEILVSRMGHGGTLYLANNKSDWTAVHAAATGNEADGGWSLLTSGATGYESPTGTPDQYPLSTSYRRTTPFCDLGRTSNCTPAPGSPGLSIATDPVANLQGVLTASGGAGASARVDCSGNWVTQRDATETRIIGEFVNGTGKNFQPTSAVNANGGALPTLGGGTACADTDGDGIPDAYETAHGLNPNDASDGARVQSDGYTNLEHYLNGQ